MVMIRTALGYLAVGFFVGALLLAHRGVPLADWLPRLRSIHAELLLLRWTAQLVLGVAFWILPRFRHGPGRGNETAA
jgi:hypothetical protein